MLAKPKPKHFPDPAASHRPGRRSSPARPRVLRHHQDLDEQAVRHRAQADSGACPCPGVSFYAAPEIEYLLFTPGQPGEPPKPLDSGSYFELTVADLTTDLRKRTVLTLEDMGIPVEYTQHEDAPSQREMLRHQHADHGRHGDDGPPHCEGIAHDSISTRLIPKPLSGVQGSGRQRALLVSRVTGTPSRTGAVITACRMWGASSSPVSFSTHVRSRQ